MEGEGLPEAYLKHISGRGILEQVETSKNQQQKRQYVSKVNYIKIFLVEQVFEILGKIFGIK